MSNNEKMSRPPRKFAGRGPMGGGAPGEKANDFKSAIKRLFSELNRFKVLIVISLVLAALSSILSIVAPNKLSDLTDEISKGLVVNKENLQLLTTTIKNNMQEGMESLKKQQIKQMESMGMSSEQIQTQLSTQNSNSASSEFDISNMSEDMKNILFKEIEIDGTKISIEDQYTFLKAMNELGLGTTSENQKSSEKADNSNIDANKLYSKIDEMPESIKTVIEPKMDMEAIQKIALFLVAIYLCSALFNYIESISMTDVANKFAKSLRTRISEKINKLPLKYFDKHQTGDILSRVTNDVDTIAQSMNQSLATLVSSITLFVGTIIMMFYTNWVMALTAIISSSIGFVFMFAVLKRSQKYFIERQVELGNLNSHIEEIYSGLNVVKVYNGKREADEKFDELNKKVYNCNQKSQFLSGLMQPMMNFIGNFGYVAVCIAGALLTMNDLTTFGVIVAFIMYVRLFTSPLSQIAQALTSLQSTAAASERVFEFADEPEMSDQSNITNKLERTDVKGKIEFDNVEFYYDGNEKPTIKDFSAIAKPGQKIAIVGPTGAGKTTMVNLLMKFYEINSGDIKIDGVSTKDLTRENIHNLFTMVLQDTWLCSGTIKENIIFNKEGITDEQVEKVCETVGLSHFIKTLPHGYNTEVSDNDNLSAGQKQLLTIARAMLQDAPFLILDEATSNVDTRTEELVQKAMDKLTEGKTSFIIAHRLSTIKNADLILVMKNGNIVEQGNHEELMKLNGAYAELYNSQFEKVG
jgi:ATP-binding cassette subfamily B protein